LRPRSRARGFTYLLVLFALAFIGVALAQVSDLWTQTRQRDKERELLFIGHQFRDAIAQYYERSPGTVKRYPEKLEQLLEDKRYLATQRYLRRVYIDPMTGQAAWGLVPGPGGGVMGVYSLSEATPVKIDGFDAVDDAFAQSRKYSDWRFVYVPPELSAGTRVNPRLH
jgi:type II secretory pathway pseudopilin PulG